MSDVINISLIQYTMHVSQLELGLGLSYHGRTCVALFHYAHLISKQVKVTKMNVNKVENRANRDRSNCKITGCENPLVSALSSVTLAFVHLFGSAEDVFAIYTSDTRHQWNFDQAGDQYAKTINEVS